MRDRRVFALVSMDALDADVRLHAIMLAARWVYFEPPKLVFVPSKAPPFLADDSNKRESVPKDCP